MDVGPDWLLEPCHVTWKGIGHRQIVTVSRLLPQGPEENREEPKSEQQVSRPLD
jgi:hypothetical protein